MERGDLSEEFKCKIADEVKAALNDKDRIIEDSPYKEYLYKLLQGDDIFNEYHTKYDKKSIMGKVYLITIALTVVISYIWSRMDPLIDFPRFALEFAIFSVLAISFVSIFPALIKKRNAMMHYIPIIRNNLDNLESELNDPCTSQERKQYIAVLHYVCNFLYTRNKYTFKNY